MPLVIFSCREIRPLESDVPVSGYQLSGTVTNSNGIVLDSVSVYLSYRTDLVGFTPLDTTHVMITDSTKFVSVVVYNVNFQSVRQLFYGHLRVGPMPRFRWNEVDDSGRYVASGKYYIKYQYDTAIVKVVPYLADGHRTTMTNHNGSFTLANNYLPVGEQFDLYDTSYVETDVVLPEVRLIFMKGTLQSQVYDVPLQQNKITYGVFKLE